MPVTTSPVSTKRFPILFGGLRARDVYEGFGCPSDVPWGLVETNAKQCERNHGQTPERLAERGGLHPVELVAVIEGRPWFTMSEREATRRLLGYVEQYESASEVT